MIEKGFYIVKDKFFQDMNDPYLKGNKEASAHNHLTVTSENSALEIEKKAKKIMNLIKKGIKFTPTQPDIKKIIDKLTQTSKR